MAPAPSLRLLRPSRLVVAAACASLVLAMLGRLWFVDGLVRRVTIDGPSMAPAYWGAHYKVQCGDCDFPFRCDAEHVPSDRLAACPNCGYVENSLDAAIAAAPERVLIDRWPFLWHSPSRGDVVAIRSPDGSGDLAVKRIAGLPGERLGIRDGDLFSGESRLRKSLSALRATRMLVHDNQYRPHKTGGLPDRWRARSQPSRWKALGDGYRIEPATTASNPIDWLDYEHWPCTADARRRGIASSILDNDSFNQGETHRPLNPVSDIWLSCRLQSFAAGRFYLSVVDGHQQFDVEIEPDKQLAMRLDGKPVVERRLRQGFSRSPVEIEFGLCDEQVLLAVDGRVVIRQEYQRTGGPVSETLHPLSIGASTIGLEVSELRVWRDIYYLDPQGLPRWWSTTRLAADRFAVLGDNQPVSIDSRHWEPPAVARQDILGRVYRPFWRTQ